MRVDLIWVVPVIERSTIRQGGVWNVHEVNAMSLSPQGVPAMEN